MTALIIVSAVVLAILLILMIPAGITVKYHGGFFISVDVLFIKFRVLPEKQKKIRLRDYSKQNFKKRMERERRRAEKKAAKKKNLKSSGSGRKKAESADEKKEMHELLRILCRMRDIVFRIVRTFAGHIRTKLVRADIAVGAEDAASCALLYGAVSQLCAYIIEFLEQATKLKHTGEAVSVRADFEKDETCADIEIAFSVRLFFILTALIRFGIEFLKFTENDNK